MLFALGACPLRAGTTYYVWTNSAANGPGTSWTTAFRDVQSAIDVATSKDDVVLVTNGVYASGCRPTPGGSLSNRVVATNAVVVRSVNGPDFTTILGQGPAGYSAVRCAYLANGAVLSGFTLSTGATLTNGNDYLDRSGGGVYASGATVLVCRITGNTAHYEGGGIARGVANGCSITRNVAGYGGGVAEGVVNNCTISGNEATYGGGGTVGCSVNNSIVYYNQADMFGSTYANNLSGTFTFSCTVQDPGGTSNITVEPNLASGSCLASNSPCIAKGSHAYCSGVDIHGDTWADPPCIGCDQYIAGTITGILQIAAMDARCTNVVTGVPIRFGADIRGKTSRTIWDFQDGCRVTNQPFLDHSWRWPGNYAVSLTAYNGSYPLGVSTVTNVQVIAPPIAYVNSDSRNPSSPFDSWSTAAVSIQDAIDTCVLPGSVVLVTNGIYSGPGNRGIDFQGKAITLTSVNGAGVTIVDCMWQDRGFFFHSAEAETSILDGFTIRNGVANKGGGIYSTSGPTIRNCIIVSNSATGGVNPYGGGIYCDASPTVIPTIERCTIKYNSATTGKGGGVFCAYPAIIRGCKIIGNRADMGGVGDGGGIACNTYGASLIQNCLIRDNAALNGGGISAVCWYVDPTIQNCTIVNNSGGAILVWYNSNPVVCNTILWGNGSSFVLYGSHNLSVNYSCIQGGYSGTGNIVTDPAFVAVGDSNYRLRYGSPCIDAGTNLTLQGVTNDLDRYVRPVDGTLNGTNAFDIGAYEYDPRTTDSDRDGACDWSEIVADTNPTGTYSVLTITSINRTSQGILVAWKGGVHATQYVCRGTSLCATSTQWSVIFTNPPPTLTSTNFIDIHATNEALFYRLDVR